jgi:hypothetical protein
MAVAVPDVALLRPGARHRVLGWGEALAHALAVVRAPKPVVELEARGARANA